MEIVEKVKLELLDKEEELEARVDTGAEITMFNEETLIKLGSPHISNKYIDFGGVKKERMPLYALGSIKIRNCVIVGPTVIGGRKNLIGHDILQRAKAVIDEGKGEIEFPENDGTIEI